MIRAEDGQEEFQFWAARMFPRGGHGMAIACSFIPFVHRGRRKSELSREKCYLDVCKPRGSTAPSQLAGFLRRGIRSKKVSAGRWRCVPGWKQQYRRLGLTLCLGLSRLRWNARGLQCYLQIAEGLVLERIQVCLLRRPHWILPAATAAAHELFSLFLYNRSVDTTTYCQSQQLAASILLQLNPFESSAFSLLPTPMYCIVVVHLGSRSKTGITSSAAAAEVSRLFGVKLNAVCVCCHLVVEY
ncbi:unnamed protein product [Sphagnum troendelagicum]|uniref:Uncharacterized protein n=1 Tax=Sphagnum jensenii TaxID=128206 RepID=A0ABP0WEA7_9BRYO